MVFDQNGQEAITEIHNLQNYKKSDEVLSSLELTVFAY